MAGLYLASIFRRGRGRKRREAVTSASPVDRDRDPLAALDELLAAAPPIQLTDWVRIDPRVVTPLVDAVRVAAIDLGRTDPGRPPRITRDSSSAYSPMSCGSIDDQAQEALAGASVKLISRTRATARRGPVGNAADAADGES